MIPPVATPQSDTTTAKAAGPGRPKDPGKRAAILDAAKRMFVSHGFERVSMDQIAAEAGVSKLTVYSHFGDKESLFAEAVRAHCEQGMPTSLFVAEPETPVRQRLTAIGNAFFSMIMTPEAIAGHRILCSPQVATSAMPAVFWEAGPQRVQQAFAELLERRVASGELVLREGTTHGEANVGLYWRYESWIRRNLSAIDSMFGASGPFYAIRRELFVPIPEDILLDDMYLPLTAYFKGYRLVVEPKAVAYDYPMTPKREFRRKLRTLGGNYQLLVRMPQLLTLKNRMLGHFLCYKVGRLLLPWLFLALLLLSPVLPSPWNAIILSMQALLYTIALLDRFITSRLVLKRISSPAHTFLVLMAATLGGLKVFFVNPRTLWKVTDIAD